MTPKKALFENSINKQITVKVVKTTLYNKIYFII